MMMMMIISWSNSLFLKTQIFGRAVTVETAAGSTAVLHCLSRNRQVSLSSCQTHFCQNVSPQTRGIIHPFCLVLAPVLVQRREIKNSYNIRSYVNIQDSICEQNRYFHSLGDSDPSRSLIKKTNTSISSSSNWNEACLYSEKTAQKSIISSNRSLWKSFCFAF